MTRRSRRRSRSERKRRAQFRDHGAGMVNRFEVVGERQQAKSFQCASLHLERVDDRLEIGWCSKWKTGMIRQKADRFTGRPLRCRYFGRVH